MAVITISNAGGNWNATTTWVGGVVPTAADDVVATATSGSVTVNTGSACLTLNLTNYTGTLTFSAGQTLTVSGNVTFVASMALAGTGSLAVNANATLNSGGLTFPGTLLFNATGAQTVTLANNWTVTGTLSFGSTSTLTINTNQITALGSVNVSAGSGITGTFTLVLSGSSILQGNGIIRCNVNINSASTVTLTLAGTPTLNFNGATFTYTSGTVVFGAGASAKLLCVTNATTLNTNGITWPSIEFQNLTVTLTSDLTTSGTLTINTGNVVINGVGRTFNIGGSITLNRSISGTASLVMNGTGTWSASAVYAITNNLTFAGAVTVSGTVYYNTGTLKYTSGTITTSGSTMIVGASTTFDTVGMTWNNVTFGGTATMTLTTNMTVGGTLLTQTNPVTINGAARTLYVGGSLTINQTTSGTATIELTGTGTWSSTGFNLSNNLIFNNGANSFTVSGSVYYITGTMTYTSGTIVTTGSTLFTGTCTLNTNGINWVNLSATSATVTMTSNLNITGTLTTNGNVTFTSSGGSQLVTSGAFSASNTAVLPLGCTVTLPNTINVTNLSVSVSGNLNVSVAINGSGVNISGNLSAAVADLTYSLSGTAPLNMVGTGTISTTGGAQIGTIYNPVNINTSGTITLGTYAHFGGAVTYTAGILNGNSSLVLLFNGFSLNGFNDIYWDATVRTGYNLATITLNSSLNTKAFVFGGSATVNGTGTINCGSFTISNAISGSSNVTATLNVDVYVSGTTTFGSGPSDFQINGGKTIFVGGDLSMSAPTTIYGSGIVRMVGTGIISSAANYRQFDLIIDTPGNINIANTLYWNLAATAIAAKTITYLRGNVTVAKTAGLYIGNLNATFTNMHRIPWPTVTITAGQTITLNEFFSGTANYKTIVQSTSASPYTISFTDGFEKTTKFVEISNCTLTRPNQLIVAGDCRAKGTNRGIRYTNQSPNGLPKNLAKTKPSMTFDTGGLVPDPNFIRLK